MWYLSHRIRGLAGNTATHAQIQENCQTAIDIANEIKMAIRSIDFYVPGAVDEFVQIAWKKGYITEKQILDVDCAIIDRCEGIILYTPDGIICGGCKVEKDYAEKTNKPVFIFEDVVDVIRRLSEFIVRA